MQDVQRIDFLNRGLRNRIGAVLGKRRVKGFALFVGEFFTVVDFGGKGIGKALGRNNCRRRNDRAGKRSAPDFVDAANDFAGIAAMKNFSGQVGHAVVFSL